MDLDTYLSEIANISHQDFSKNVTKSIFGGTTTPSSFNIFQDSLKDVFNKMDEKVSELLPQINLQDCENEKDDGDNEDVSDDQDTVPLDFRTAMVQNKVVIQAKPLSFKTDDEIMNDLKMNKNGGVTTVTESGILQPDNYNNFMQALTRKSFDQNDKSVTIIEPEVNLDEELKSIDLRCNLQPRLNNSTTAPQVKQKARPLQFNLAETLKKKKQDQKGDGSSKIQNLDQILNSQGTSIDEILSGSQQEDQGAVMPRKIKQAWGQKPLQGDTDNLNLQNPSTTSTTSRQGRSPVKRTIQKLRQRSKSRSQSRSQSRSKSPKMQENQNLVDDSKFFNLDKARQQYENEMKKSNQQQYGFYKGVRVKARASILSSDSENDAKNQPDDDDDQDQFFHSQFKKSDRKKNTNEEEQKLGIQAISSNRNWDQQMHGFDSIYSIKSQSKRSKPPPIIQQKVFEQDTKNYQDSKKPSLQAQRQDFLNSFVKKKKNPVQQKKPATQRPAKWEQDARLKREKRIKQKQEAIQKKYKELMQKQQQKIQQQQRKKRAEQQAREKYEQFLQQQRDRKQRERQEEQARRHRIQKLIVNSGNGSDIGVLFDKQVSFREHLSNLPLKLNGQIHENRINRQDIVFRRYKLLIVPYYSYKISYQILSFFLAHSSLPSFQKIVSADELSQITQNNNNNKSPKNLPIYRTLNKFPFKTISLVMTLAQQPFKLVSLHVNDLQKAERVFGLLIDTEEDSSYSKSIEQCLKGIQLKSILSQQNLKQLQFIQSGGKGDMKTRYLKSSNLQNRFNIQSEIESGNIDVLNNISQFEKSGDNQCKTLSDVIFLSDYSTEDSSNPLATKEGWEFMLKPPAFNPYNPFLDNAGNITQQVRKSCDFGKQTVTVLLKNTGRLSVRSGVARNAISEVEDSLEYFWKISQEKYGLEVVGARLVYLNQGDAQFYQNTFHRKIACNGTTSVLALALYGENAYQKLQQLIGNFDAVVNNSSLIQQKNFSSVRGRFALNTEQNIIVTQRVKARVNMDLAYWFGGRSLQKKERQQMSTLIIPSNSYWFDSQLNNEIDDGQQRQVLRYIQPRFRLSQGYLCSLFISPILPFSSVLKLLQQFNIQGVTTHEFLQIFYTQELFEQCKLHWKFKSNTLWTIKGTEFQSRNGYFLIVQSQGLLTNLQHILGKVYYHAIDHRKTSQFVQPAQLFAYTFDLKQLNNQIKQISRASYRNSLKSSMKKKDESFSKNQQAFKIQQLLDQNSNLGLFVLPISLFVQSHDICHILELILGANGKCLDPSSSKLQERQQFMQSKQRAVELLAFTLINCDQVFMNYSELINDEENSTQVYFNKLANSINKIFKKQITQQKYFLCVVRNNTPLQSKLSQIYSSLNIQQLNQQPEKTFRFTKAIDQSLVQQTTPHLLITKQTLIYQILHHLLISKRIILKDDYSYQDSTIIQKNGYIQYIKEDGAVRVSQNQKQQEIINFIDQMKWNESQSKWMFQMQNQEDDYQTFSNQSCNSVTCIVKPGTNQISSLARLFKILATNNFSLQNIKIRGFSALQYLKANIAQYNQQVEILKSLEQAEGEEWETKELTLNKIKQIYMGQGSDKQNEQLLVVVQAKREDAIAKMSEIMGHPNPKFASKKSLRKMYGQSRWNNGFAITQTYIQSTTVAQHFFNQFSDGREQQSSYKIQLVKKEKDLVKTLLVDPVLVVVSPYLIENGGFQEVFGEFISSKFKLCGLSYQILGGMDIRELFAMSSHNLDVLQDHFLSIKDKKGMMKKSLLLLFERQNGNKMANQLVGQFIIKNKKDFEGPKEQKLLKGKVNKSFFNVSNNDPLINDYGAYMYVLGKDALEENIPKYFNQLINSNLYKLE